MGKNISNNENAIIRKKILSMILPITMENLLEMLAGFVSMAMIGRISTIAISSLGISNRIINIVWALFKGIATGASVFVAQAYGANDHEKMRKVTLQTIISSLILAFILQQLIFWNAPFFLKMFDPSSALLENATIHLKIASWGLPFLTIILIVAGILQGTGNAKTPMRIAFIMNLLNLGFSYALIFGHFGFKPMGLKGAAISTVLAQIIASLLGLWVLFSQRGILSYSTGKNSFKLDKEEVVSIYKVGLPSSFESIFWQIAAIIITKIILSHGEVALAAYQLGLQAESISYMPAAGFGVAATTFIGQTLGSGEKELGKKYLKQLIVGTIIITIFTAGILILFPEQVMRILTDEEEVIKIGIGYLFVMGFAQLPLNIAGVINGALRGAGYTKVPMIVAGIGLWGIRVPLCLLMTYYFKKSIMAIWIIIGIDMATRLITSCLIYKSKDIYGSELLIDNKRK
ncbi:putative MATE family efflux protein [Keratinibaculum paraultunense]|uniref:Probable multidrug resistance protein NorM n=1 Tax=Keratinibaculum paraultunense TaxID=1278232 RepID=A0A4R3KXN6_9FIRM|nr:MATE family efflux transporter [Keratinibaculum paraultunense]QQY78865.1 MATE family efflux transporter [Keratinibaculum paraultunense]TCS90475.1 putative MATE family efflux protein [Keratinibaculum paraultunense]